MKNKLKLNGILLILALLVVCTITAANMAKAAGTVVYDYNNTTFGQRTKDDVAAEYSKAKNAGETYVDGQKSTYYSTPASIEAPYNQGILTDDTLASMEAMTNFYRYLTGAKPLLKKCVQNESLQYQALDRNFQFDHYISNSSKPDDMDDELWQKGFNLDHNILAMYATPFGSITSWMNEGYSLSNGTWDTTGHRMALISPQYSSVQFGYSGHVSIGKICESRNTGYTEPFSAFPAAGYMPDNVVYPDECVWSTYLNKDYVKVQNPGNVLITVKNLTTGESYTCKSSDSTASISTSTIDFVQPKDATNHKYVDNYSVTITGLKDVKTGDDATIKYEVKFFDVSQLAQSYVKSVSPEGFSKLVVYKSMNDTGSLKKIAAVLPKKVKIVADSGLEATVGLKGDWVLDEKNKCYTNEAKPENLPGNISDKLGILKKISVTYEISDDRYDAYNRIGIKGTVAEGNTVKMYVYRTMMSAQHSKIFKIYNKGNGIYSGIEKFDRYTSKEFDAEESSKTEYPYDYYNFGPLKASDSGEYISIYYSDDEYFKEAYVSVSIVNINIKSTETTEPGTTEPGTTEPGTTEPGTTEPGTTKSEPGTTEPGTTKPEPGTTKPEPGTTEPGTTEPGTTEPGTVKPTNTKKDQKVSKFKKNKPTLKVKAKKKRVKLLIGKVVGATKYQVRYKQGKKWKTKYTKSRALTIKKLKSKKQVKIQVRAVMVYEKKKVYGLWVKKSVRVK